MTKLTREDIHIISRHGNWSVEGVDKALKQEVYNDKESWQKFIRLFIITLGVGFTTTGIVFFFAYNWAELHKFVKIGLIESLIVATTLIVLFAKISLDIKNILLTCASVLVGVLFAVFGQVYQTGANAYDFFLGWTLFITLWVAVSNFAPLWLLFITLINTTLVFYSEQVANHWSTVFMFTLLFMINVVFLLIALIGKKTTKEITPPMWFTNLMALASVTFSTIGITMGIINKSHTAFLFLLICTLLFYALGISYGLKTKSGFYLSIIPFSIIVIISVFLINLSDDAGMFLIISLFIVGSVTLTIKNLLYLQKKWMN